MGSKVKKKAFFGVPSLALVHFEGSFAYRLSYHAGECMLARRNWSKCLAKKEGAAKRQLVSVQPHRHSSLLRRVFGSDRFHEGLYHFECGLQGL